MSSKDKEKGTKYIYTENIHECSPSWRTARYARSSVISQRATSFYIKSQFPEAFQLPLLGVEPFLRTQEKKKSHGRKTLWLRLEKCSETLAQTLGGVRGGSLDDGLDPPIGLPPAMLPRVRRRETMTPSHYAVSRQNFTIKTHWLVWEGNSNWCGNPNALFVSWAILSWREKRKI